MTFSTITGAALVALLCGVASGATETPPELPDQVVAVVNKEVITSRDVMERASAMLAALQVGVPVARQEQASREILSRSLRDLIDEKLLKAEGERLLKGNEALARRLNDLVNSVIEDERRAAGGEVAFREAIRQRGTPYDKYVEKLRGDLLRDKVVIYQFVLRDLSVSPMEVLDYYRSNADRYRAPAKVRFRQILVSIARQGSREKARARAEEIMGLLRDKGDFAEIARKYSDDDAHARDGGLWDGPVSQGSLAEKAVDELLFSLPAGEVGGPVQTDRGFAIVKADERQAARTIPFEEVRSDIEAKLLRDRKNQRYEDLMKRLEAENYVEIVR